MRLCARLLDAERVRYIMELNLDALGVQRYTEAEQVHIMERALNNEIKFVAFDLTDIGVHVPIKIGDREWKALPKFYDTMEFGITVLKPSLLCRLVGEPVTSASSRRSSKCATALR